LLQAPVQNFTGNVSAGFKGCFTQAKALLHRMPHFIVLLLLPLLLLLQAPVQNFTGNVSAGFKGGFTQAKALLNKAAASVSEAATSVGAAAAAAATKGKEK
jgi:hypothetical protein